MPKTAGAKEREAAKLREKRAALRAQGLPTKSEHERRLDNLRRNERRRLHGRSEADRARRKRIGLPIDPDDYSNPLSDVRLGP